MDRSVYIGMDPRLGADFAVCQASIESHVSAPLPNIFGLSLPMLRQSGHYTRPTEVRAGGLWDTISDAPMSTEFAISRFLVSFIASGRWALFLDSDMLVRADINELFALADPRYAVQVVKHSHSPSNGQKMDGQAQTAYPRKNWSSVYLLNLLHSANDRLTLEMVNSLPGRDLHAFCWLEDHEIGSLPEEWNWLCGHSPQSVNPKIVHYTDGSPGMSGREDQPYADEWRRFAANA